ncbi:MAG: XRE family transcriptional regulator [Candidatus Hydrogenedentota bacterium]|nr:MAG: XRE family transcriptional regulator [Candidatus Hydrogenedentota bacterium]
MNRKQKAFLARLGARIRRSRQDRGWSQMKLADEAGLTQKYISEIECGKRNPSIDCVRRIGESLGLEIRRLFQEE